MAGFCHGTAYCWRRVWWTPNEFASAHNVGDRSRPAINHPGTKAAHRGPIFVGFEDPLETLSKYDLDGNVSPRHTHAFTEGERSAVHVPQFDEMRSKQIMAHTPQGGRVEDEP
jgi:hypothetical protein